MPIEITIPRLGWSMDEGMFGEWLKEDGDRVEPGEPLFTLEGDKALQDIESVDAGILHVLPDGPQGGDTVQVGMLVGYLLAEGEEPPQPAVAESTSVRDAAPATPNPDVATSREPSRQQQRVTQPSAVDQGASAPPDRPAGPIPKRNSEQGLPAISPRAARVAEELGVDWTHIAGSGKTGRIRERDVRTQTHTAGAKRTAPTGNVRRTIARRMLESARSTVPVTLTTRADATQLVSLRQQLKQQPKDGIVPAYQDMITKLVAVALHEQPVMNSRWENEQLIAPDGIHIAIAVDTESGLLAPVLRHVERMSLRQLAAASSELVRRARARACRGDELQGGTFTITNLGAFGIDAFTPVINAPEIAILGLGVIRKEAVVSADDRVEVREQISLSLTFNHCAIDGAPAARFLQRIVQLIESPKPWLDGDGVACK